MSQRALSWLLLFSLAGCALDWSEKGTVDSDGGKQDMDRSLGEADASGDGGATSETLCAAACDVLARCEVVNDAAVCICPTDYRSEGTTCIKDADCAELSCDANARCVASPDGAGPMCECAEGFAGDGQQCQALLVSLASTAGALEPALSPDVTTYDLLIPMTTDRLTLTPSAPAGASIFFNDTDVVQAGSPWLSPVLAFGTTPLTISVREPSRPNRDYLVKITRGKQTYLKGSKSAAKQQLGSSVAIDGDTLVVGASAYGRSLSGSAYVFVRSGQGWKEEAYLQGDTPAADDEFGASVDISGDTLAIGAPGEVQKSGRVYVYTRANGVWSKQAVLKASNSEGAIGVGGEGEDGFGTSVALDGDRLAVGAPGEDSSAHGVSALEPTNTPNDALEAGAVYVFSRSGIAWKQAAYVKGSKSAEYGLFGASVALSGVTLVVGAPGEETNGQVYVFVYNGGLWGETAIFFQESARQFGQSVAIDGNTIAVGAPFSSSAFVFEHAEGAAWMNQPTGVQASTSGTVPMFGISVALSGDTLVVGASMEAGVDSGFKGDPNHTTTGFMSGAVYVFSRPRDFSFWRQPYYVKAPNTDKGDAFGGSVAVSGNTIVAGARAEDGAATTVDGDALDNSANEAGAAYVIQ